MFKAEEIVEKGRNFHLRCFTCKKCSRPQTDKLQVYVGFDGEVYCKVKFFILGFTINQLVQLQQVLLQLQQV